jgi:hypothetical protein
VLLFDPDPDASYELSVRVLWLIKSAGFADEYFCFADLKRYRDLENLPAPRTASGASADCHPELRFRE